MDESDIQLMLSGIQRAHPAHRLQLVLKCHGFCENASSSYQSKHTDLSLSGCAVSSWRKVSSGLKMDHWAFHWKFGYLCTHAFQRTSAAGLSSSGPGLCHLSPKLYFLPSRLLTTTIVYRILPPHFSGMSP